VQRNEKELKIMRMGYSWKKGNRGMGVTFAVRVSTEPGATVDLSVLNCMANKARDQAWKIGDQAMKKASYGRTSAMTRGC
jgi:hypothetical protein